MRDATEFASKLIEPYSERIEELEEENRRLRQSVSDAEENARILMGEGERLRQLVCAVVVLAGALGVDVTGMQAQTPDGIRKVSDLMAELGVF